MGIWLCSYPLFHAIFKEAAARIDHRIEQASTTEEILINPENTCFGVQVGCRAACRHR